MQTEKGAVPAVPTPVATKDTSRCVPARTPQIKNPRTPTTMEKYYPQRRSFGPIEKGVRLNNLPKGNKLLQSMPPLPLLSWCRQNHMQENCWSATSVTTITLAPAECVTAITITEKSTPLISARCQLNRPPEPPLPRWVRLATNAGRRGISRRSTRGLRTRMSGASEAFQQWNMKRRWRNRE